MYQVNDASLFCCVWTVCLFQSGFSIVFFNVLYSGRSGFLNILANKIVPLETFSLYL